MDSQLIETPWTRKARMVTWMTKWQLFNRRHLTMEMNKCKSCLARKIVRVMMRRNPRS